jgi:YfiH family protein
MLIPDWPAPENVVALTTKRTGGVSSKPYQSFNLAHHVGDQPADVELNRQQLMTSCSELKRIQWLEQIHSDIAVKAGQQTLPQADASFTDQQGLACAVMTADCLPLLVCDQQGNEVAAIHAGWRGLLNGIIEKTVQAMSSQPEQLMVWMGPAISAAHFEVGPELREQFVNHSEAAEQAFLSSRERDGHYLANLYLLATLRLRALAVTQIYGGEHCTFADTERFYSYRRDGITGRMVSLIYRK